MDSKDQQAAARALAETEKRQEFHALIEDVPPDVATYDQALLVANHMARKAALKLFPDDEPRKH